VDPVGLVFPVKGLAFGGAGLRNAEGEEDPSGEALNAWLAEGVGGKGGEKGDEEEEEEEEEAVVWRRLWEGTVACYPSLKGREGEVACALVSGGRGFRRLGSLDRLLPPSPVKKEEGEGEEL
jgi:hypothetical protein